MKTLEQVVAEHIDAAIKSYPNLSQAAQALGLHRNALHRWLKLRNISYMCERVKHFEIMSCAYCGVKFPKDKFEVAQAKKKNQTNFFCCIDHFANHRFPNDKISNE
jgi:hypothetical protein